MRLSAIVPVLAALAAPAAAQEVVASGTLQDVPDHAASGGVEIVREGDGFTVVMGDDFRIDDAPDPYVAFGSADAYAEGTNFAAVESPTGAQSYAVPEGIDPTEYEAVWMWCEEFSVPLGVAPLE